MIRAKGWSDIAQVEERKRPIEKPTKPCMPRTAIVPSRAYHAKKVRRVSFPEREACSFREVDANLIDVVVCMPTFLFPPLQGIRAYPRRPTRCTLPPMERAWTLSIDGEITKKKDPLGVAVAVLIGSAV